MPSQEPIHVFVYGTLIDPQRVEALTGRQFARVEAVLEGFERIESDTGYPYILPKAGASVSGFLLNDIDTASLRDLDDYEAEGDLYVRQEVEVLVAGEPVPAMTYVGYSICAMEFCATHGNRSLLSPSPLSSPPMGERRLKANSLPSAGRKLKAHPLPSREREG